MFSRRSLTRKAAEDDPLSSSLGGEPDPTWEQKNNPFADSSDAGPSGPAAGGGADAGVAASPGSNAASQPRSDPTGAGPLSMTPEECTQLPLAARTAPYCLLSLTQRLCRLHAVSESRKRLAKDELFHNSLQPTLSNLTWLHAEAERLGETMASAERRNRRTSIAPPEGAFPRRPRRTQRPQWMFSTLLHPVACPSLHAVAAPEARAFITSLPGEQLCLCLPAFFEVRGSPCA